MLPAPRPLDRLAVAVMLALCASWGVQQVAAKVAIVDIPPITQVGARSLLAAVLVGAFSYVRDPGMWRRDGTLFAGIAAGLLFSLEFILLYVALEWTSAGRVILFVYTAPFFVALGGVFFLPQERLRPLQWAGLALAFVGAAGAIAAPGGGGAALYGDALSLVAAAAWGATTIVIKASSLKAAPAKKVFLYQIGTSAIVMPVAALIAREKFPTHLSTLTVWSFLYQTLWVAVVTYPIWFWLVSRYRAGELAAFTFLTPVIGVFAGYFLLGEPLSAGFAASVALVAGGIVLVNFPLRAVSPAASRAVRQDPV
jgi:drug/metabolite transporter (DMT)-like permease